MFKPLSTYSDLRLVPVLFWLITQLLMTGIITPVSASTTNNNLQNSQTAQIIICTPTGLKAVSLALDGSANDTPPETDVPCKWCVGFAKTILPASTLTDNLHGLQEVSPLKWHINSDAAIIRDLERSFHIRAPPLNSKIS